MADCNSSPAAGRAVALAKSYARSLVVDLAFAVEPQADTHLPTSPHISPCLPHTLTHAHWALHFECRGAPVVRRGDARVAPPCPTTSCVWRSLPYLTLPLPSQSRLEHLESKKERKKTHNQGRDGRTARRHHTGILRRGVWCASRRPPWGVCLFVSLFAVSRRFSLQPSCHLAAVPLSSVSPLSLPPLSRRSLLPRPATPPSLL